MTPEPSEEAEATSSPIQGPPEASSGNEADSDSVDSLPEESQSPDPLPADILAADITAGPTQQQDIEQAIVETTTSTGQDGDQASMQTATSMGQNGDQASVETVTSVGQDEDQASAETATSMAMSISGDKDESPDAPSHTQENPEEITFLLAQDPGTLQAFVGFQNPVWDRLAGNTWTNRSHTVSLSNSQNQNDMPQKPSNPKGQPETVPPAPNSKIPSAPPEEIQLSVEAADPTPPFFSPPAGNAPPSPDSYQMSLGRNLLDINLYRPNVENDYRCSMTSLLGRGKGSISSLADILVWSDSAMGMGMAVGFLISGRSSPADMLQDEGPSLRTVASLLGSARSALSSGLAAGTGSALRSVTYLLESMERQILGGIRSSMRYLTNHFTPC
ncbi:testis-expressed protein 44 [Nannospalax galili]|uniref:testis-expressed protein 44 n=1 Tax=Nannospalax galili TaxID=1026970 RepID=UPI0004ED70B6|nr:testis-expressed protein 44 [Nannospalax galili]